MAVNNTSLVDKNQAYWNGAAKIIFKDNWVHNLQKQISDFLVSNLDWTGVQLPSNDSKRRTKLMDCACDNKIVYMSLHHLFSKCIGIDVSDGRLDKYRATAASLGLPEHRMIAVQVNLLAPTRLASRLRPGGVFLIIDWATRDSSAVNQHASPDAVNPEHPAAFTISHDIFTQEQIVGLFDQAGCGDARFVLADRILDVPGAGSGKMQLFWGWANKF
ncbi:hypothetical protein BDV38DRAFT_279496 [Aspergillus pseudotamarii]|uniref:Methyltransferase domain-containing protein n=1 Tax=Aspergillus pseudotamarii TaxID=132259 RepID=A0A5N6T405_ASPPS|nr:uncharacterized protein BDV38DRAFT_279496 [Aspergillus pseudotamarii]KAE8141043.1 hypothetical protein BDV38DRAFT_279496 [Aspergillus pseudotamarii]